VNDNGNEHEARIKYVIYEGSLRSCTIVEGLKVTNNDGIKVL